MAENRDIAALDGGYRLQSEFSVGESIGHAVLWIIVIILTLGLGALFFPYFQQRSVIKKTVVIDNNNRIVGRIDCDFNFAQTIGHVIIWAILILITLGLAAFIYIYRVQVALLQHSYIKPV